LNTGRERGREWGVFERRGREGFAKGAKKKIQNKTKNSKKKLAVLNRFF
jgi:hypothetical protein